MQVKSKLKSAAAVVAPVVPVAAPAEKAKAPVHAHREANMPMLYKGLSPYLNANRKTDIAVKGDHAYQTTDAQLPPRTVLCHTAIKAVWSGKSFPLRGLDNACMARLIHAGLIEYTGGMVATVDGIGRLRDGSTPAMAKLTVKGAAFGK